MPLSPIALRRQASGLHAGLLVLVLALLAAGSPARAASATEVTADHGMVVSPERLASEAGVAALEAGGTAIDAAVASALVLAVTYPEAGNLGGGGFLLYREKPGGYHALDFRETAPAGITADLFLDENGDPISGLSLRNGLAVGVPGSVPGLYEAHRRWGRRPWAELVEPAIRLARDGFVVYPHLAKRFREHTDRLLAHESTRAVFAPEGTVPVTGDRLRQPDLAATLERVARQGVEALRVGPIPEAVARTVRREGGVMTVEDLAGYRPTLRDPLIGTYRGHRVVTFPPPSSGGIALLQMLTMLERFDVASSGFGSSANLHRLVEVQRRAFADRSRWLGDPDFYDVPQRELLDPDYLARRARSIRARRAGDSRKLAPGQPLDESGETLHLSIVDREGRAVSMTTTLNTNFGSGIVAEGTGILLNNEMDDFSLAPGVPNTYGLVGGEANAVAADKRPLSSMTPTLVEQSPVTDRPFLVLGSPGGGRIINSVLEVIVNVVDHRMRLQVAVDAPRIHHQWLPDTVYLEPLAAPQDVARALRRRGHRLEQVEEIGNVNAIRGRNDGTLAGAADPRRSGHAAGH